MYNDHPVSENDPVKKVVRLDCYRSALFTAEEIEKVRIDPETMFFSNSEFTFVSISNRLIPKREWEEMIREEREIPDEVALILVVFDATLSGVVRVDTAGGVYTEEQTKSYYLRKEDVKIESLDYYIEESKK